MKSIKRFLIIFVLLYILLSLPKMLGFGFEIDWVQEATVLQKLKVYVVEGFKRNYVKKLIIASIASLIANVIILNKADE